MEKYNLLIFPSAKQDLRDFKDYINELSPQAAYKLYDEIIESIGLLAQMPKRCPLVKSSVLRANGYRMLIVHNYLVFFIVNGETVQIRRILYNKRQFDFLL